MSKTTAAIIAFVIATVWEQHKASESLHNDKSVMYFMNGDNQRQLVQEFSDGGLNLCLKEAGKLETTEFIGYDLRCEV